MSEPLSENPKFDALRNALYHTARAGFLGRVNRIMSFLIVLLGASVMARLAGTRPYVGTIFEFSLTAMATAQLVFDFGAASLRHEFLQKRYYEALAEMEAESLDEEIFNKKWSAKLITIAADESLQMRALDAVCYNKALDAIYTGDEGKIYKQKIPLRYYFTRHFFAFPNHNFYHTI